MAQYIDKAAIMAEIEKIREQVIRLRYAVDANCIVTIRNACECLESSIDLFVNSIDTLEMKEVDVDREIRRYRMNNPIIGHREGTLYDYMANAAKHFFELGLKAQDK